MTHNIVTELHPVITNQKSFYGKALIKSFDSGYTYLQSYETNVCKFDAHNRTVEFFGYFSATTNKHIWEFLNQVCDAAEYFPDIYRSICKRENCRSFSAFLRRILWVDLSTRQYATLNGEIQRA